MNEEEFINKLKSGHPTAFPTLIQIFGKKILNTCYRFLLNEHDAEDISQEVFIEVYKSIQSFKGNSKLSTWIYRIAVAKCLDEIKRKKRKKRITSIGKILHLDEVVHWIAGGTSPDNSIKEKENLQEVMQALNSLPDNQRIAFTLSKIEGYTNLEISEIMNTSTVAVESLIYRAKKRVSKELEFILKNNHE